MKLQNRKIKLVNKIPKSKPTNQEQKKDLNRHLVIYGPQANYKFQQSVSQNKLAINQPKGKMNEGKKLQNRTPDIQQLEPNNIQHHIQRKNSTNTVSEDSQSNFFAFNKRLSSKFVHKDSKVTTPQSRSRSNRSTNQFVIEEAKGPQLKKVNSNDTFCITESPSPAKNCSASQVNLQVSPFNDSIKYHDINDNIKKELDKINKLNKFNSQTPVQINRKLYMFDDSKGKSKDNFLFHSNHNKQVDADSINYKGSIRHDLQDFLNSGNNFFQQETPKNFILQGHKSIIIKAKVPKMQVFKKTSSPLKDKLKKSIQNQKQISSSQNDKTPENNQYINLNGSDQMRGWGKSNSFSKLSMLKDLSVSQSQDMRNVKQKDNYSQEFTIMNQIQFPEQIQVKLQEQVDKQQEKIRSRMKSQSANSTVHIQNYAFKLVKDNQSQPSNDQLIQHGQIINRNKHMSNKNLPSRQILRAQHIKHFQTINQQNLHQSKPPLSSQQQKRVLKKLPPLQSQNQLYQPPQRFLSKTPQNNGQSQKIIFQSSQQAFSRTRGQPRQGIEYQIVHRRVQSQIKKKETLNDLFKNFIVKK